MISGDKTAGFSIFWADDGLDTGPILLQKSCPVEPNDTVDSLYKNFLYPEGIKAMAESVNMVANGTAPKIPQPEEGASYEPMLNKKELQQINWDKMTSAEQVHNFVRGLDSTPGAWTAIGNEEVRFYSSAVWDGPIPEGEVVDVDKCEGIVHSGGLLVKTRDGSRVNVERLKVGNKTIPASKFGKTEESNGVALELSEKEKENVEVMRQVWENILNVEVGEETDFFASGEWSLNTICSKKHIYMY